MSFFESLCQHYSRLWLGTEVVESLADSTQDRRLGLALLVLSLLAYPWWASLPGAQAGAALDWVSFGMGGTGFIIALRLFLDLPLMRPVAGTAVGLLTWVALNQCSQLMMRAVL